MKVPYDLMIKSQFTTSVNGRFNIIPVFKVGSGYNSIEEFLNALVGDSEEAFCARIIAEGYITATHDMAISNGDATNGSDIIPVFDLWEVKARSTPSGYGTSSTYSPDYYIDQNAEPIAKVSHIGKPELVDVKYYPADGATGVDTDYGIRYTYKFRIELKGDRKNPHFFWSDEMLDEPENRTYIAFTQINWQTQAWQISWFGTGVMFVDIKPIGDVLQ